MHTKITREWLKNIIQRDHPGWQLDDATEIPDKNMNETFEIAVIKNNGVIATVSVINGIVGN